MPKIKAAFKGAKKLFNDAIAFSTNNVEPRISRNRIIKNFLDSVRHEKKTDAEVREDLISHGIPRFVRKRGVVLHYGALEPGDLILVSKKRPPFISRKIIEVQELRYDKSHAQWHHAMVSNGNIGVIEASVFKVVALTPYWKYLCGNYDICIRRVEGASYRKRRKIAESAKQRIGLGYGWLNILSIFLVAVGVNSKAKSSSGVICSQLFYDACTDQGIELFPLENGETAEPSPASLHACGRLKTVAPLWLDLEPEKGFPNQSRFAGYDVCWKKERGTNE